MMSIRLLQTIYSHITGICKLFLCDSKLKHALLASKRRLIDLLKGPFKTLTNALLEVQLSTFSGTTL